MKKKARPAPQKSREKESNQQKGRDEKGSQEKGREQKAGQEKSRFKEEGDRKEKSDHKEEGGREARKWPRRRKSPQSKKAVAKKAGSKKPTAKKKAAATKKPAARRKTATATKARPPKTVKRKKSAKSRGSLLSGPSTEFKPYSRRRGESYMNDAQLEHFRDKLLSWKRELMEEVDRTVHHMKDEAANFPDPNDRATQESEFSLELRTRDRERKLLRKIDSALQRIKDGSYGYCEETGEEIGLKRLEARPVATLCLEAQESRELAERQYRDDR